MSNKSNAALYEPMLYKILCQKGRAVVKSNRANYLLVYKKGGLLVIPNCRWDVIDIDVDINFRSLQKFISYLSFCETKVLGVR